MLPFDWSQPASQILTDTNHPAVRMTGTGRELSPILLHRGKKFWAVAIRQGLDYILPTFQAIQATPAIES